MREIKFRLIKDNKIVGYEKHEVTGNVGFRIYHSLKDEGKGNYDYEWFSIIYHPTKYIDHDHKEQYINKKDKNGVKIFEGDDIRILYTDWPSQTDYSITLEEYKKSISQIGKVVFHNCSYEIEFTFGDQVNYGFIHPGQHGEIEIIGTIHEDCK